MKKSLPSGATVVIATLGRVYAKNRKENEVV